MIRRCKNCAGRIIYDIKIGKLLCSNCSSTFGVEEYSSSDEFIDTESHKFNADIYSCSACGAEIVINGTEASTFCVYCGNPTVVFDRVAEINRPEMIIPFKVTREEALQKIKDKIKTASFLPKEFKDLNIDTLRGIYIPYYVVDVEYDACKIVKKIEKRGKYTSVDCFKRSGYVSFPWLTVDASRKLNDSLSKRLDPFYIEDAQVFDEDYLIGFYSDIADVSDDEAISNARIRAKELFDEAVINSVPSENLTSRKFIYRKREDSYVLDKPVTAMLPAWFMTIRYKDTPYTILVNGQTGKVVGGFPIDSKKITTLGVTITSVITLLLGIPLYMISNSAVGEEFYIIMTTSSLWVLPLLLAALLLNFALPKIIRAYKTNKRSKSKYLANYANDRQGV